MRKTFNLEVYLLFFLTKGLINSIYLLEGSRRKIACPRREGQSVKTFLVSRRFVRMDVLLGRRFVRTALDVLSGRTCLRRFVRKTFCQDRLRRFVRTVLRVVISWAYLGLIFGISQAYLGHISGISRIYLGLS